MLTDAGIGAVGLATGLLLAAVFAAAGLGKLTDRAGTRKAVGDFGAPDRLAAPLALALPVAELAAALALVFAATRPFGAAGALVLLVVFSAAIGVSLARGRAPDCHCFGQLHSAPASWKTLARNALLAVLAAVALTAGGPGAFGWIGNLAPVGLLALASGVVATGLVVAGCFAFISLIRSHGRVLLRLDTVEGALREAGIDVPDEKSLPALGIDPGSPAPRFTVEAADGREVSLDDLLEPGHPLLLLFTSPTCGPCHALLPDVSRWQREYADQLTVAMMSGGEQVAVAAEAEAHGLALVLVDRGLAVLEDYQVTATPGAVLISADGRIASYLASGAHEIAQLFERAVTFDYSDEEGLPIGSPVPEFELTGLDGEAVSLTDPDRNTLVLFWNPSCGFCQSMLDDLRAWKEDDDRSLRLLVVSSGETEATRKDGLRSPVAIDPEYAVGKAFNATGTPMAVLVDRDGRVASGLAAGAVGIMALGDAHRDRRKAATS